MPSPAAARCRDLGATVGAFAARRLEEAGLGPVAEKIARTAALDRGDAALLESADVALLGKLVELKRRGAARQGFTVFVSEPLRPETPWIDRLMTAVESLRDSSRSSHEVTGLPTTPGRLAAWCLEVEQPPDQRQAGGDGPLGVDVLRAVAIARLLLPDDVAVVAPVSQLGPKLARLALEFGADAAAAEPIEEETTQP